MQLDGKKIVLTGGGSGIGKELLEKLCAFDVEIIVGDINPQQVDDASQKITATKCDVGIAEDVDALFQFAIDKFGKIDIFIANAGFAYYEKITEPDWKHIEKLIQVDMISPMYSLEKMAKLNRDRKYIVMVNASAMAYLPMPGYAIYSGAKMGLHGFVSAYRHEHNDQGTLSIVYPIATKTEFFSNAGNQIPVPFPSQTAKQVANKMISGLRKNKKVIYPSLLFRIMLLLNNYLPFLLSFYLYWQRTLFARWVEQNKK